MSFKKLYNVQLNTACVVAPIAPALYRGGRGPPEKKKPSRIVSTTPTSATLQIKGVTEATGRPAAATVIASTAAPLHHPSPP